MFGLVDIVRVVLCAPCSMKSTSGAQVRVASEKSTSKATGERFVYIKGNADQREKALEIIRGNPKVRFT